MSKYQFNEKTKELFIHGKKMNLPGSLYELESKIGDGANGIVLKGRHSLLDKKFAIKFWLPYKNNTTPDYNKFLNEVQKIAKLDSDKIVKINNADVIDNQYFYAVYEFVEGETLKDWLKENQDFQTRYFILKQIYTEMKDVHKKRIYHGDLHDKNILIKPDFSIKIIDFGTSFFANKKEDSHQRETELLLNTGLSLLEQECKMYDILEKEILITSPPECVPCSMLMLGEIHDNFSQLDDELDDYGKKHIILSLAHSVCDSPFFKLDNIIQVLENSIMDKEHIDLFVSSVSSVSLAQIVEVDEFKIVPMKATQENINLLKLNYLMLRKNYLQKINKIRELDS